ncbi:hypothetical protein JTB14_030529 [Gonioctena quinquepunctata]|nr:hypothetical protein JTB14_030529 [Gonioctena quinquepunctata]
MVAISYPQAYGLNYASGYVREVPVQSIRTITEQVPVHVPKPVPVSVTRTVPVPTPYQVTVPKPYAVPVRVNVPVEVPKPYAVKVDHKVPVAIPVRVPIEIPRPYIVYKNKQVKVEIEKPVFVKEPVSIKLEQHMGFNRTSETTGTVSTAGNTNAVKSILSSFPSLSGTYGFGSDAIFSNGIYGTNGIYGINGIYGGVNGIYGTEGIYGGSVFDSSLFDNIPTYTEFQQQQGLTTPGVSVNPDSESIAVEARSGESTEKPTGLRQALHQRMSKLRPHPSFISKKIVFYHNNYFCNYAEDGDLNL